MANPLYDDPRYKYDQPKLLYDGGWITSGSVACRVGGRGGTAARKGESQAVAARAKGRGAIQPRHDGRAVVQVRGRATGPAVGRRDATAFVALRGRAAAQIVGQAYTAGQMSLGGRARLASPAWVPSRQGDTRLSSLMGSTTTEGPKQVTTVVRLLVTSWSTGSALAVRPPPPTLYPLDPLEIIDLGHVYRGDTLILPLWQARDQRGNLLDLTDALIWFTAKQELIDPDLESPTIQVSTTDGWVTVLDAEAAIYRVVVPPHETQGLLADTYFTFDVQAQWDAPVIRTIRRGVLVVMCDVTRAMA